MRRLLMCPPDFYGIEYEINPWMSRSRNSVPEIARAQWHGLRAKLESLGAKIELVAPQQGLPDMVFTANAALIDGRRAFLCNFRHEERRGEAPHFGQWFATHGYEVVRLPEKLYFEGEGDALFAGETLFCGYRIRSDVRSHEFLADKLDCLAISLELVNERFYHLDTCFCPLPDGRAFYFPGAFDEYGRRAMHEHIKEWIEVAPKEAVHFACNAVVLDKDIVLPEGCPKLYRALEAWGYRTHALPMTEFIKAGGACKCLVLYLN
jgi:N-dimethylarginine dimethylaminohydrolase